MRRNHFLVLFLSASLLACSQQPHVTYNDTPYKLIVSGKEKQGVPAFWDYIPQDQAAENWQHRIEIQQLTNSKFTADKMALAVHNIQDMMGNVLFFNAKDSVVCHKQETPQHLILTIRRYEDTPKGVIGNALRWRVDKEDKQAMAYALSMDGKMMNACMTMASRWQMLYPPQQK